MFNKAEDRESLRDAETVIGQSVKVKGDFNAQGNIVVEGILEGNLNTGGSLLVGNKAKVIANVEAKEATINGHIEGNLKIKGYLDVGPTARIFGDIVAGSLSVAKGATINGKCSTGSNENNSGEKETIKKIDANKEA